jgi:hypothetical protein
VRSPTRPPERPRAAAPGSPLTRSWVAKTSSGGVAAADAVRLPLVVTPLPYSTLMRYR